MCVCVCVCAVTEDEARLSHYLSCKECVQCVEEEVEERKVRQCVCVREVAS